MKIKRLLKYTRWVMVSTMSTIAVYMFIVVIKILKIFLRFFVDNAESFNNTEIILLYFGFIYLSAKLCSIALNKARNYLNILDADED